MRRQILTLLYHFHLLHKYLDFSWAITAESSPLHKTNNWTQTYNLWISQESHYPLSYVPLNPASPFNWQVLRFSAMREQKNKT